MEWIPLGRLTRTHGLKGEFRFQPYFPDDVLMQDWKKVRLADEDDPAVKQDVTLVSIRGNPHRRIIKFGEVNSVEEARNFTGKAACVPREDFPKLPAGEYYRFEIEGLQVYDETDRYYGEVVDIIETGSNDVYVVRDGDRELLVPMIESVVKTIDLDAGKLIFHPVEGLLEDTAV